MAYEIEKRTDSSNSLRACQNCKKDFQIEPNDFGFYEKLKVPLPTFCPSCRMQRRYAWRNAIMLYTSKCALCEKSVVTIYSPNSGITVYCNKCWWSDKWDPKSYAMDYDFSKPFFQQFDELMHKIPHMAVVNDDGIASLNCEYTHDWWFAKNCYMTFSGWYVENVMYSFFIDNHGGKDMMDCIMIRTPSEWIYECMMCSHCYEVKYSQVSLNCINSSFLYDCRDCQSCFMCSDLRSKKYHYKNKEYSKEEYEKIISEYKLDTFSGVERAKKDFDEFMTKSFRKYIQMFQCLNCTGDYISTSKNTKDCFVVKKFENSRYCDFCTGDKDAYDLTVSGELSECYEGIVLDHSQMNMFGIFSPKCQEVKYMQHCHNCKYSLGCDALRNSNYCILNKQYTKEEYEELLPKIIKQMNDMPYVDKKGNIYKYGEFFPSELSPFGYNETQAIEQIPYTKDEAIKNGFKWQDNLQRTTDKGTILPENIPESIHDITENILNEVLTCIECKRNYKIVKNEFIFYKKLKIPIPRKCFYCRHAARVKLRNPFKLWHRSCMCDKENHGHDGKCKEEFETTYGPGQSETIYCEKCYQKEVY